MEVKMDNLFFKDIRGNLWAVSKIIGFVRDTQLTDEGKEEFHYFVILEGGMSTEITATLYNELLKSLITLEATELDETDN